MDNNLYIFKSDVKDRDEFESMIGLHNCVLAQEDDHYYILEGSPEDIASFHQDWIKFDLYLYLFSESDKLIKIPHLSMNDAKRYAVYWFEMNDLHEYMIVTEGSTPWSEPVPDIEVKTPEWISLEYAKISKEV